MSPEQDNNTSGSGQDWWGPPPRVPWARPPSEKELKKSIAAIKSQDPANTSPPSFLDRVRGILDL